MWVACENIHNEPGAKPGRCGPCPSGTPQCPTAVPVRVRYRTAVGKVNGVLFPCGITTFPSEKLRDELTNFLAGQSAGPGKGGRTGAFLAGEVLSAQFPDQ